MFRTQYVYRVWVSPSVRISVTQTEKVSSAARVAAWERMVCEALRIEVKEGSGLEADDSYYTPSLLHRNPLKKGLRQLSQVWICILQRGM